MSVKVLMTVLLMVGLLGGMVVRGESDDARICTGGKAERIVKPDVALVLLYLSADGVLMVDAEKDFREKFAALEKALKDSFKQIRSIDTKVISLGQKFSGWNPQCTSKPQPEIRKQVIVAIPPEPALATAIIDVAIRHNAMLSPQSNTSYGGQMNSVVIYGIQNYESIEKEVQAEAVVDLRKNAERMAVMIGRKIKRMTEFSGGQNPAVHNVYINGQPCNLPLKYYSDEAGRVKISASFNGRFELID